MQKKIAGLGILLLTTLVSYAGADDREWNAMARVHLTTEASLQMNDSPSAGAQQQVSLWQMGLVGVKCTRIVNWAVRRPAAVATLRSVLY